MIFDAICQSSSFHFPALVSNTTLLAPNIHYHAFLLFSLNIHLHHFLDVLGQNSSFQFSVLATFVHTDCVFISLFLITQVHFFFLLFYFLLLCILLSNFVMVACVSYLSKLIIVSRKAQTVFEFYFSQSSHQGILSV